MYPLAEWFHALCVVGLRATVGKCGAEQGGGKTPSSEGTHGAHKRKLEIRAGVQPFVSAGLVFTRFVNLALVSSGHRPGSKILPCE